MANMMQMMAKAQKFKSQMQELQARIQATAVPGQAGNGLVTCIMTGNVLSKLRINPSIIKTDDVETLEDLVTAAVNDARAKAEQLMTEETQKLMSDMGLPPGLGLPF